MIRLLIIFCFFTTIINAREVGQTEITTEDGIEVYQKEKYYLLKKNVVIESDNFNLKADHVKAFFDKDLYDIINILPKNAEKFHIKEIISVFENIFLDEKLIKFIDWIANYTLAPKGLVLKLLLINNTHIFSHILWASHLSIFKDIFPPLTLFESSQNQNDA